MKRMDLEWNQVFHNRINDNRKEESEIMVCCAIR